MTELEGRARSTRGWAALAMAVLTLAVSGCGGGSADQGPPQPGPGATYAADIRRTSFGIPHVLAANEASLGFGIGYAYAQDNFCILADEIVTVNGERSRYFGPTASNIYQRNNLRSDFYFKLINDDAQVDAYWAKQIPEVQALYRGYVAGFNKFLRDTGAANLPGDCKGQPWVRQITTRDMMRVARRLSVEASGIQFIDALFAAQPPAIAVGARAKRTTLAQQAKAVLAATEGPLSKAHWTELRERFGSNALALGSDATESGRGMLLGNPHFPWFGVLRFYQMHLTIPGRINVMGGALNGFPGINIGYTDEYAWSHTVNTSAHFSLFVLSLDPADPTRYLYDGQSVPMTRKTLTVEVRQTDGSVVPQARTYYSSAHGPIIVQPGQLPWSASNAFALKDANLENWRLAEQWYRLNRAGNLNEFKAAVEGVVGIPWVNTVAVDKQGNGYYANVTVVPNVPTAKENACVPAPFKPLVAAANLFVLAGSTSACEWGVDPSAPQVGIFAARDLPTMSRRDYLHNANDSAWLTNPAAPITGYPNIVSRDGYPQAGRTRIGLSQAQARLAGTDGRPGNKFNLKTLQDIALSNRVYFAEATLTDALAVMCSGSPSHTVDGQTVNLAAACGVLSQWDRRADLFSVGVPLFEAFWTRIGSNSAIFAVPFSAADPVNTPRGIAQNNAAVATALRDALARSVLQLNASGIPFDRPWGGVQLATKNIPIPIHGAASRTGDTGLGVYNSILSSVIGPQLPGARAVTYGTSYIQTVTWDDGGPVVGSFLTYSLSSNPASPNYADQTLRFAEKDWISPPFNERAIANDPGFSAVTVSE